MFEIFQMSAFAPDCHGSNEISGSFPFPFERDSALHPPPHEESIGQSRHLSGTKARQRRRVSDSMRSPISSRRILPAVMEE